MSCHNCISAGQTLATGNWKGKRITFSSQPNSVDPHSTNHRPSFLHFTEYFRNITFSSTSRLRGTYVTVSSCLRFHLRRKGGKNRGVEPQLLTRYPRLRLDRRLWGNDSSSCASRDIATVVEEDEMRPALELFYCWGVHCHCYSPVEKCP